MLPINLVIESEDDLNYVLDVYNKYKQNIYYTAKHYVKRHQDAQDCAGEAIVEFIENLDLCRGMSEAHLKNFLFKCTRAIAINKFNQNCRINKNEFSLNEAIDTGDFDISDTSENIERIVVSTETVKIIEEYLQEIDPIYGDVLYFRIFVGMSAKQVADMLGITTNTVNQRVRRGKILLIKKGGDRLYELLTK